LTWQRRRVIFLAFKGAAISPQVLGLVGPPAD
jgi:hypothetical protein